jgi:hypothetical protein
LNFFSFRKLPAKGPNFKQNKTINSFRNVDVYSLLCRLLNIKALPNNGSADTFNRVYISNQEAFFSHYKPYNHSSTIFLFLFFILSAFLIIFALLLFFKKDEDIDDIIYEGY